MPKSMGGTGIRELSTINITLLTKLAWRILTQPETLLVQDFMVKYGKDIYTNRSKSSMSQGLELGFNVIQKKSL